MTPSSPLRMMITNDRRMETGLLTNVQNIGGLIALPFAPLITDGLGRRKAMFVGGTIMLGGVVLQVQSLDVAQFILARGMSESLGATIVSRRRGTDTCPAAVGFGIAFSVNAAPLLIVGILLYHISTLTDTRGLIPRRRSPIRPSVRLSPQCTTRCGTLAASSQL